MPNFSTVTVHGAAETIPNIWAGSAFEFIGRPSRVAVGLNMTAAVAGTVTIQFGPEVQLEEGMIPSEGAAVGVGINFPDGIMVDDVAAAGDRLVGRVTVGAACSSYSKVRILPVG